MPALLTAKRWAAAALCHPLVGNAIRSLARDHVPSLRFRGLRLYTDAPGVTPEVVASIFWGIYESAELRFVKRYLRPDLDVVEIGASIGGVSAFIAGRLGPGRRLVCVEANPALIPTLQRNLSKHAGDRQTRVLNAAIGYGTDQVSFVAARDSTSGRTVAGEGAGDTIRVPACTLSDLLEAEGLGDFALVADIEGAEFGFIQHDAVALARCRQLLIELHDTEGRVGAWATRT